MTKYSAEEIKEKIRQHKHWYHSVEVAPGIVTPGVNNTHAVMETLELPDDCTGLRVLDLGARDGFFSFLLEKRGASEVVAIDHVPPDKTGFSILKEIFQSNVAFHTDNIYNISVEKYGQFDIVLCLGLLYHLRSPLLALDKIRDVCQNELYIESHIIGQILTEGASDQGASSSIFDKVLKRNRPASYEPASSKNESSNIPLMRFYPKNELNNDHTNWWGFNAVCLEKLVEAANFNVLFKKIGQDRAVLKCKVNHDPDVELYRNMESGVVQ